MGRRKKPATTHGIAVVDKPAGVTSHDVVAMLRRRFDERQVGHGGTLDPGATGVLVVAVGKATKLLRFVEKTTKAYVGEIVPYAPELTPDNVRFLYQPMECQGCLGDCHLAPVNGMYPCVAALDDGVIVDAVREMFQSPSSSSAGH